MIQQQSVSTLNIHFKKASFCGDYTAYIPDSTTQIKYVNTRIIIVQKTANDPQNFHQDSIRHTHFLTSMINGVNYMFANIEDHTFGGVFLNKPNPSDAKIQFVLRGIDYYQDSALWDIKGDTLLCSSDIFDAYGVPGHLNIIFRASSNPSALAGVGCGPSYKFCTVADYYRDYVAFPPGSILNSQGGIANTYGGRPWVAVPLLAHEIGHSLGLPHTFDPDWFDDTPYPDGNAFGNCNNDPCSSNMMSYNIVARGYLSPKQIGYIHFLLSTGDRITQLTACTYSDTATVEVTSSQTWPIFQVIGGNLTIKNSSTLTVQCNVSIPQGGTVFVEPNCSLIVDGGNITNSCTSGVSPDIHLDPYSRMIVQDSSVLTIEPGATLEVHEHSQLIIKNGSKLIIQNGGDLRVHFNGLVIIENGAELVLNNKTAGKGLCIGCNSTFYDTGELRIQGKLTTADSVNLTNNGDGFISVRNTGVLNLGSNSNIKLTGKGRTDRVLKLDNVTLSTAGHQIDLVTGKIECVNGANLKLDSADTLHMSAYSEVLLAQNSTLTISSSAKLEVHEHSSLIAQNTSKLILDSGATLAVHYLGLVHVQAGGELIVKDNSTAPFTGLCIAPTPNPG